MNIAFPVVEDNGLLSEISSHFGRSPYFLIVESNNRKCTVITNTSEHMGGIDKPPEIIAANAIDVLILQGIGRKALEKLIEKNIRVYCTQETNVQEALSKFDKNELIACELQTACSGHQH